MAELLGKKWFIFFVLIFLLGFQLIYSFLFPSSGFSDNWQPISTYLPKFQEQSSDNFLLAKIYPLISSEYRLNSDTGHYLELGRNFSPQYFKGSPFLERPLYPFLISLFSQPFRLFASPSYGITFGSAILVNFVLIGAAVLLFFSLLRRLFSLRTAWLSSLLLIFSPFVHSFLNQPLAEMLMVFAVVLSAHLLYEYVRKPSIKKLAVFSLIIGVLMLGKMFFAISFFIFLLAVYSRRHKEGIAFSAIHLIPFSLWYLWITWVWRIGYYSHEVQHWQVGVWLLDAVRWPWQETAGVLLSAVPGFIAALLYSFILIPVIFSVIGLQKLPLKAKNVIYFGALLSVFLLGFLQKFYYIRHIFLVFPVIYPACVLGLDETAHRLGKYRRWLAPVFYVVVIGFTILISNVNIYQVFNYDN